jgi:two-component system, NarL family, sensor histidine kinase UhpB
MPSPSISTQRGSGDTDLRREPVDSASPKASDEGKRQIRLPSLLSRIFAVNALVLVAIALLLIASPVTISFPISLEQTAIVLGGLAVMLVADLVLVRRTLAPLRRLTAIMGTVDPKRPGRRLHAGDAKDAEVGALAEAFNGMLERLESERRQSARQALSAQEDERLRIARELHDQVGQTLTAVTIQAERAAEMDGPVEKATLEQIADAARRGLKEVSRIARDLRPEALDDLGLINALITLCRRLSVRSGLPIERDLEGGLPPLQSDVELVIYRVAQEGITNAIRHAKPSTIEISLAARLGAVALTIRDDGRGLPDPLPEDSAGISGMRERALLVDGSLDIRSRPGQGTEVTLEIPIDVAAA